MVLVLVLIWLMVRLVHYFVRPLRNCRTEITRSIANLHPVRISFIVLFVLIKKRLATLFQLVHYKGTNFRAISRPFRALFCVLFAPPFLMF